MNKTLTDQQIEAAKEAGFYWHPIRKRLVVRHSSGAWVAVDEMLAHFATLVVAQQPEPRAEVTDDDKADAERYRLLKSIPFGPGVPAVYRGIAFSFAVSTGKPGFIRSCRGDEMDAAIDAARAGEGQ
jgi:hypothetical protein